jgi:hypothetical protein
MTSSRSIPDVAKELGKRKHVHRFTLRTGKQVISSTGQSTGGGKHIHVVDGNVTTADSGGISHFHKIFISGIEVQSGPSAWPMESGFHKEEVLKSIMPDLIDPEHTYVFKTGEYGLYDYWYRDRGGNYWRYSNAPEDHKDFDPKAGVPLLDSEQPLPHTAPQYFTPEGRKRHVAVPLEVTTEINPSYNPLDTKNVWYETYESPEDGSRRYVYLDSDVRENLDLWIQYQLRVTDAGISRYRQFASNLFNNQHPKDRILGAMLMLVDQGLYEIEDVADALVEDLEFIDETVKFLGRKFVCDPPFLDFLTSMVAGREMSDPLFVVDTAHGRHAFGYHYLYSVYKHLKISPHYLLYWRASQMFARIMNRLAMTTETPPEEIEGRAMSELQRMFGTVENIRYMVDHKVRETLLGNYGAPLKKALTRQESDDYGTLTVWSDLIQRRGDELVFSQWLHAEPLHDITPEEEAEIEAQMEEHQAAGESEEAVAEGSEPGQSEPGVPSGAASPGPEEGELKGEK